MGAARYSELLGNIRANTPNRLGSSSSSHSPARPVVARPGLSLHSRRAPSPSRPSSRPPSRPSSAAQPAGAPGRYSLSTPRSLGYATGSAAPQAAPLSTLRSFRDPSPWRGGRDAAPPPASETAKNGCATRVRPKPPAKRHVCVCAHERQNMQERKRGCVGHMFPALIWLFGRLTHHCPSFPSAHTAIVLSPTPSLYLFRAVTHSQHFFLFLPGLCVVRALRPSERPLHGLQHQG